MAKRGPMKKHFNWCDFGQHYLEPGEPKRHVFPIPICEAFPEEGWPEDGATACLKHYDDIFELQVEQGLVIPVQ